MDPGWAAVGVALLVGAANLAVTLCLRASDRRVRQAIRAFDQDVGVPMRTRLDNLEELSTRIKEAAGHTDGSERQRVIKRIFDNEKTQVLAAFDRPLDSARLWSRDAGDMHLARLRDLEVQIDLTLAELASSDGLMTTHRISELSRGLSDEVRGFSTSCRVWLNEISEALSSGRVQPPARRSGRAQIE